MINAAYKNKNTQMSEKGWKAGDGVWRAQVGTACGEEAQLESKSLFGLCRCLRDTCVENTGKEKKHKHNACGEKEPQKQTRCFAGVGVWWHTGDGVWRKRKTEPT